MTKILKFNNAIFNLDNLEVIEIKIPIYYLHFTTCIVTVHLTEEEFLSLTEFLKNDFKFYEINKRVDGIYNDIANNIKSITGN
ncbi:hypothetical protein [Brachyspira pilosicoli]|uniref:hypothetical protein n=1 Tax=Brachyspira pilosicoli TaxID=52584 RepID=UPI00242D8E1F|nr:hypothetical protein [Brachyspira pilosicoli]